MDSILDEDFNFQELKQTVKSLKNTAPGQDNITNEIIKHLPESYLMVLLDFYNFSWNQGTLPDQWKLSIIIPVDKKDKDKLDAKSYRPISLTSSLEKLWKDKSQTIIMVFGKNGLRKNKNTQEQLFRLQNTIRNALNINYL